MQGPLDPNQKYAYVCEADRELAVADQTIFWLSVLSKQEVNQQTTKLMNTAKQGKRGNVTFNPDTLESLRRERWASHVHRVDNWGGVKVTDAAALMDIYETADPNLTAEIDNAIQNISSLNEGLVKALKF